jgi:L-2-hydroxyglutarate oxidase LhgO
LTDFDAVVAGAGVVGLAVARALARAGRSVAVLEAAGAIGTGTSSRSSEVIHAGIYYPPGSLRARFCAPGRRALYGYCSAHGVAARACGKLIVAQGAEEEAALALLTARGLANGVEDLRPLSGAEARAMESALSCSAALLSPCTGIVDSHALMLSLLGEAQDFGAVLALDTPVAKVEATASGFVVWTGGLAPIRVRSSVFVNAAGHGACALAAAIDGLEACHVPRARLAKGSYFTLAGPAPFGRLIYPVPIPGGAGIHLTLDMGGQARFGPDVEAVDTLDYRVDPARGEAFYAAIRRYWPALPDGALQPGYAGIRPKIVEPTEAQDFVVQDRATHGVAGLVNLFGIESPGLTSCLAIGEHVAGLIA